LQLFVTSQKLIRQIKTDSEAENDENKARSVCLVFNLSSVLILFS